MLNRCIFDEEKCAVGIRMLESYKRAWDGKSGCWKEDPIHSEASHGADAFRMLALSLQETKAGMSIEQLNKVKGMAGMKTGHNYNNRPQMPNYQRGF